MNVVHPLVSIPCINIAYFVLPCFFISMRLTLSFSILFT